jgi:hypothetical protein
MPFDFRRLQGLLNGSDLSTKNPNLFQCLKQLIQFTEKMQQSTTSILNGSASGVSPSNLGYLTDADYSSQLPLSRELIAGLGITFDDSVANERTINSTGFHWTFKNNLTNAEFKALPTTYIQIIPAPGVGKTLVPLWGYIQVNAGSGAYTNVDTTGDAGIAVGYGSTWSDNFFSAGKRFTGVSYRSMFLPLHEIPDAAALFNGYQDHAGVGLTENEGAYLVAWNPSGDYTGGHANNTFRIGVAYYIMDYDTGVFS